MSAQSCHPQAAERHVAENLVLPAHRHHGVHLRVRILRLTAGQIPCSHIWIARSHIASKTKPFVTLIASAEQQLKLWIILFKEGSQISLQPRLHPMKRLQNTYRRQKQAGTVITSPSPPETFRDKQHHQTIDRRCNRPYHRNPEQNMEHQVHYFLRRRALRGNYTMPRNKSPASAELPEILQPLKHLTSNLTKISTGDAILPAEQSCALSWPNAIQSLSCRTACTVGLQTTSAGKSPIVANDIDSVPEVC